jgi:hypothetical protein
MVSVINHGFDGVSKIIGRFECGKIDVSSLCQVEDIAANKKSPKQASEYFKPLTPTAKQTILRHNFNINTKTPILSHTLLLHILTNHSFTPMLPNRCHEIPLRPELSTP